MASFRKKGRNWYFTYTNAAGKRSEVKGCPDKRVTEQMAAAAEAEASKVRAGLVDPRDLALREHGRRPLGEHIEAWGKSLGDSGGTDRHVSMSLSRVRRLSAIVMGAGAAETEYPRRATAADRESRDLAISERLEAGRLSDLTAERVRSALGALKSRGMSLQSLNHHRAAVRSFDIWCLDTRRTREASLRSVKGFNAEEDRRHDRRTLGVEELRRLIEAARLGPVTLGVAGSARSLAYRLAVATGLRYSEIRSIRPASFDWSSTPATVDVTAAYAKNGRSATQTLPHDLASDLRPFVEEGPQGEPVFPLPADRGAEMLRVDLEAAGIPYVDEAGRYFDFHSLRCQTATMLDAAGVTPRVAQRIMRHSTPGLTDRYTRPRAEDVERAALSMPSLRPGKVGDGEPINDPLSAYLPCAGDAAGLTPVPC